jgi:cytochrome bd-type quinol oxidase subunit 2
MKKLFLTLAVVASSVFIFSAPVLAASDCGKDKKFFGMPTWYKYLSFDNNCAPEISGAKDIFLISLTFVEMLLVLAGVIAVVMVMIGGFNYMISQGESDKIAKAKNTIINALVGAVIAIIASQVVIYIGSAFGAGNPDDYGLIHVPANSTNLQIGLNIFFAIMGAVSVFMIVLAGFNFIVSAGNSEKIAKARRTIFYSLIGLVVAVFASAIVSFVLKESV